MTFEEMLWSGKVEEYYKDAGKPAKKVEAKEVAKETIEDKWNNKLQGRRNKKMNRTISVNDELIEWIRDMSTTGKEVIEVIDIKYTNRYTATEQFTNEKKHLTVANILVQLEDTTKDILDDIVIDYMTDKEQDNVDMRYRSKINNTIYADAIADNYILD